MEKISCSSAEMRCCSACNSARSTAVIRSLINVPVYICHQPQNLDSYHGTLNSSCQLSAVSSQLFRGSFDRFRRLPKLFPRLLISSCALADCDRFLLQMQ